MQQEINQLQTAINKGWLPDDIRATMQQNQHIAQVTVEATDDDRVAIVYTTPNEDDTETTHRSIYEGAQIKRLLKAANNA
jgi:hypothetical protein